MSYRVLRQRVIESERDFEVQVVRTEQDWEVLKRTVRFAMTPLRILSSGFVAGLVTGFAAPLAKMNGGARLIQFASSLITLVGAAQAKDAADDASDAADTATETATDVAAVVETEPGLVEAQRVESEPATPSSRSASEAIRERASA
jgi:hypothetical protein